MIFTVFTPTFNRSHTLHRVYKSLCAQTFTDFEWVVVDDGSQDNTEEIIMNWKINAPFPIYYKKQKNRGKHAAINVGAAMAKGDLFLIADSDDEFFPDALEIFYAEWLGIDLSMRDKFAGVTGLCVNKKNKIIGNKFPSDIFDSTPSEVTYLYKVKGEKWGFLRTSILLEFPFPEIGDLKFYPEGLIWSRVGRKYLTRYVNKTVRLYFCDAGDQLTKRSIKSRASEWIFYADILNDDSDYIKKAPFLFLKMAIQGARLSLHNGDRVVSQLANLRGLRQRVIWTLGLPVAYFVFIRDRLC